MHRWLLPLFAALAAGSAGCKRDEIQVYQAPKDAPVPAMASPHAHGAGGADGASAASAGAARAPWEVPEGWTEKPNSGGMRIATYAVTAADGRSVDISVVPLGPQAGSLLENVNRWRNELKLGPITEADLTAQVQTVPIGGLTGQMFNLVSEQATLGEGKHKERTLAALLSLGGSTVFFKLRGEDQLATENLPKFLAWLKSVQTGSNDDAAATSASAKPSGGSLPADKTGPVAPPPATGIPEWAPPAHWKSGGQRPMRLATFDVPGGSDQVADLSISALGGPAGGLLANINRWRTQQLGLPAATDAELPKLTTEFDVTGGKATLVDFAGAGELAGQRMVAAIVNRSDRTWFFKLTGPDALVAGERENLVKFVKSVKFP
jgi:hypothetical protein